MGTTLFLADAARIRGGGIRFGERPGARQSGTKKGRSEQRCGLDVTRATRGNASGRAIGYLPSSSPEDDELDELWPSEWPHDGAGLDAAGLGAAQLGAAGTGVGAGAGLGAGAGFGAAIGAAGFGAAGLDTAGLDTASLGAAAGLDTAAFFAGLFLALAFLADFFGAAALDFALDFLADFFADFLAFFADFFAAFFEDFFADFFFAVTTFFLLFLLFFFFALAIVILLLPPNYLSLERFKSSAWMRGQSIGSILALQSRLWTARRPIEKLDRVHHRN